ncbi:DUF6503 family protein [Psychroserpens sp. NJDZ02]|uniref:DUF6503 family protein n=1 Tax=Psychroserpens sp. NJDZ02 TaxID=2570561 RepID=UPI0010A7B218|nr:DUF6503 family protein [Psychroserpens sp. NJDZ02]QCE40813.1 hypothetical protein E9099_05060 [Psychroserpens sp. NJDZ02]
MKLAHLILLFALISFNTTFAQTITGTNLLNKAIKYHDPSNNWNTFNDTLQVTMEIPKSPNRDSKIIINLPKETFYLKTIKDTTITEYTILKDTCKISFNGQSKLSEAIAKANNLSCDRGTLLKNYYTYLYGLPMKLKDKGTIINQKVEQKTFKGKSYLVLQVSYDITVGSDIWFFYFDPNTYAMEVYQFFKTDSNGNIKLDTGEYILLSETEIISNILIPKQRAWYYNKNNTYLGTDILKK